MQPDHAETLIHVVVQVALAQIGHLSVWLPLVHLHDDVIVSLHVTLFLLREQRNIRFITLLHGNSLRPRTTRKLSSDDFRSSSASTVHSPRVWLVAWS